MRSPAPPAFDQAVPAYLLDENYFFLDWNVAFEELVAGPLKLRRHHSHAEDFVRALKNARDVVERSKRIFDPRRVPLLDLEPLVLNSPRYGDIEFEKIAVQITDADARLAAWSVFLNISRSPKIEDLWKDLQARLERELNWSRYAESYDQLLLKFDDYCELTNHIVGKLKGRKRCLDLGAGTGNATLALLRGDKKREVWAVESNHTMIMQLIAKIAKAQDEDHTDYFERLRTVKEDVCRLGEFPQESFDAAILINVLYSVDDPTACLQQVYELLAPGGLLVFSTSHQETDVGALFDKMEKVLRRRKVFDQLEPQFKDALARHQQMDALIHRDSREQIRQWIDDTGFELKTWNDDIYTGAVVVVEAQKPA